MFNIKIVLSILFLACNGYAQTSGLGVTILAPVFLPANVRLITGSHKLDSRFQPSYETRLFYDRYISNGWGAYLSFGLGKIPMEFILENVQEGVIYNQTYLSSSLQYSRRVIVNDNLSSFVRGGLWLAYIPNSIESYEVSVSTPHRIVYPAVQYNPNNKYPILGIEVAGGYEWHLGKAHYLLLEANALYTGTNAVGYEYELLWSGRGTSTGYYARQFNTIGASLSYKYIFKNKPMKL